jgi:hypothetical protein
MYFNENFFSFPPFLSVSWDNIVAIRIDNTGKLLFHLNTGDSIALPLLQPEEVDQIFKAHALYLQKKVLKESFPKIERLPLPFMRAPVEGPIRLVFGTIDGVSSMQHNPALKETPNLPEEMLLKIAEITKVFAADDPESIPKAEPHCNCPHCQLARVLQNIPFPHSTLLPEQPQAATEEEVQISDLQFQDWEITQTGDKLYTVASKVDKLESYSVYLGKPVGCTCGKQNCDHILAVLKS